MLESEIKKLTAAVEANTAALTGGAAPVTAVTSVPIVDPLDIPVDVGGQAAPAPAADEAPAAPAATLKDITEGIVALCKAKGRDTAALLMAEYGAQKVPDLKKVSDKYDEILAKINALIAAK